MLGLCVCVWQGGGKGGARFLKSKVARWALNHLPLFDFQKEECHSSCNQSTIPQWCTNDKEIKGSDLSLEGKIPKVVCKHSELQRHRSCHGYKTCLVPLHLHTFINLCIKPARRQYPFWLASRTGVLGPPGALRMGITQLSQVVYGSLERTQENQKLLGITKSTTCVGVQFDTQLFFFFFDHIGDAMPRNGYFYVRKTHWKSKGLGKA